MNFGDLLVAMLLAVFIYWGWDSGVAVNEESEDPAEGPGKAAVVSTLLLRADLRARHGAAQSFHGIGFLTNEANQRRRAQRARQRRARRHASTSS